MFYCFKKYLDLLIYSNCSINKTIHCKMATIRLSEKEKKVIAFYMRLALKTNKSYLASGITLAVNTINPKTDVCIFY
jgi:hypothetical protein